MRKLIQYKGGGYDGCHWEWNFFLSIKQPGKDRFIDVFSSGHHGIDCPKKQINLKDESYYVYNLDDADSMQELATQSNTSLLAGLIKVINNNLLDDCPIYAVCDVCENQIYDYDLLVQEGWHGCGGIASCSSKIICIECYSIHQCNRCSEYDPEGEMLELDDDSSEYLCQDCKQQQEKDELDALKQDVIHQSMLTGSPDLLSQEMRWFWEGVDPEVEDLTALLVEKV